jgi:hypothetical protein
LVFRLSLSPFRQARFGPLRGLGGSKRLVCEFDLVSRLGEGTRVTVIKWK